MRVEKTFLFFKTIPNTALFSFLSLCKLMGWPLRTWTNEWMLDQECVFLLGQRSTRLTNRRWPKADLRGSSTIRPWSVIWPAWISPMHLCWTKQRRLPKPWRSASGTYNEAVETWKTPPRNKPPRKGPLEKKTLPQRILPRTTSRIIFLQKKSSVKKLPEKISEKKLVKKPWRKKYPRKNPSKITFQKNPTGKNLPEKA